MSTEDQNTQNAQNTPPEPAEVPILRIHLTSLDKAMRDLVMILKDDPASEGWNPTKTPPGYLFVCDFLLNTITKYIDNLKALPIVQRQPEMLERYNGVISRNVMLCSIILDEGEGGMSSMLRQMMPKVEGQQETSFRFSPEIREKARTLMHETNNMPQFD